MLLPHEWHALTRRERDLAGEVGRLADLPASPARDAYLAAARAALSVVSALLADTASRTADDVTRALAA